MKPTIGKINHDPKPWSWKKAFDQALEELKDQTLVSWHMPTRTLLTNDKLPEIPAR